MHLFWRKKKSKFKLPYVEPEDKPKKAGSKPRESLYAEQFAQPESEDGKLKNYEIYYKDRDYADDNGDPMITVVQAYSRAEAELEASYRDSDEAGGIMAVDSTAEVVHPDNSSFAWPKKKEEERKATDLEILRRKRSRSDD